jgi:hypothetical protein
MDKIYINSLIDYSLLVKWEELSINILKQLLVRIKIDFTSLQFKAPRIRKYLSLRLSTDSIIPTQWCLGALR